MVCDEEAITQRLCNASSYGEFLVSSGDSHSSIFTTAIHLNKSEESALYKVDNTGYYCVSILPANRDNESISTFDATIEWRNPYGNLPAGDYPKLLVRSSASRRTRKDINWRMAPLYVCSFMASFPWFILLSVYFGVFNLSVIGVIFFLCR